MLSIQEMLIDINYTKGVEIVPKYILIHETDNYDKGADAIRNRNFYANHPEAECSTHFVVDDHNIVQCLKLNQRAWHVGVRYGTPLVPDATNNNTIGIEICVNSDGDYMEARQNCIELTKYLMNILSIPASNVIRHYDASVKQCPNKMIKTPSLWDDFKNSIFQSYSPDTIRSIQHDLQRVSCLQMGEEYATGILDANTKTAINQFGYIIDQQFSGNISDTLINALNSITKMPTIGPGWTSNIIATKFIQWFIGISPKNGTFDANTTQKVKAWQKAEHIWSDPDGVIRADYDWKKILK